MTIASNPDAPVFYVYVLADPRKPGEFIYSKSVRLSLEPFYVGKGKGDRFKSHHLRSSPVVLNKINAIKKGGLHHRAKIIKKGMTEAEAYAYEAKLIKLIGRKQLGTGPLLNLNDGGPGIQQGYVSEVTRKRRAKALKAYWAKVHADKEAYAARTAGMKGIPKSEEHRAKIASSKAALYASAKGKKTRKLLSKRSREIAGSRSPAEVKRIYAKQKATREANKRR